MRFKDKVCIVTGGSSGIGKATAKQMVLEGAKVAIFSRGEQEGNAAVAEITKDGGEAVYIRTDVGKVEDLKSSVSRTIEKWLKVDILVNNAAMMTFKSIDELSIDEWDKVMAVNLRSVFLLTQLCLPAMNNGAIVNVSSVHAHETTPDVFPYATSKAGIEAFTRAMSRECASKKVRVNCVAPGAIDTPMLWSNPNVASGKETIQGAVGKPEDVAQAICFLASDQARFINGTTLIVDGGRLNIL